MSLPTLRLSYLRAWPCWPQVSRGLADQLRGKVVVLPKPLQGVEVEDTIDALTLLLGWPLVAVTSAEKVAEHGGKDQIVLVTGGVDGPPDPVPGAVVVCQRAERPSLGQTERATELGLPQEILLLRDAVIECLGRQFRPGPLGVMVSWIARVADTPGTAIWFAQGVHGCWLADPATDEADLFCAGVAAAVAGLLRTASSSPAQWVALLACGDTVPERLVRGEAANLNRPVALEWAFYEGLLQEFSLQESVAIWRRPLEAIGRLHEAPGRPTLPQFLRHLRNQQLDGQLEETLDRLRLLISTSRGLGLGGPPVSEHLVGRAVELGRLQQMLQPAPSSAHPPLVLLTGPDGVGKTELAAAVCARLAEDLEPIWIDFSMGRDLGWWPVARAMGIEVNSPEAGRESAEGVPAWVLQVHERLRAGPYLVVIAGSEDQDQDKLPTWLPDGPARCALVLLRHSWSYTLERERDALTLTVPPLSVEDSRQLLGLKARHLSGRISVGAADALIYQLGGYPLALVLAAHLLEGRDLGELQENLHELRTRLISPENVPEPVWMAVGAALQGLPPAEIDALVALSLRVGRSGWLARALAGDHLLLTFAQRSLVTLVGADVRLHQVIGTYARWETQAADRARYHAVVLHYTRRVLALMKAAIRDGDAAEQDRLYPDLIRSPYLLYTSDDQAAMECKRELAEILAGYPGGLRGDNLAAARFCRPSGDQGRDGAGDAL